MTLGQSQKPLVGKLRISSKILVETGLHIGGGNESLNIGGLDKPVIRDPITQYPYLPGSSIKGKLRSILERLQKKPLNRRSNDTYRYESDDLVHGFTDVGGKPTIAFQGATVCPVSRLFGSTGVDCWIPQQDATNQNLETLNAEPVSKQHPDLQGQQQFVRVKGRNAPARLVVRDCHLTDESAKQLKKVQTGLYMAEWKFENGLDRITAAANPRQVERVPKGSVFSFELVYTIENETQAIEDLQNLAIVLAILEDDALGGHGSRGYGKIRFQDFQFYYRGVAQYQQVTAGQASFLQPFQSLANTSEVLEGFDQLSHQLQSRFHQLQSGDDRAS